MIFQLIAVDDLLSLARPEGVLLQITPPNRFTFPSDPAGKAAAFDRFIRELLDAEVLELTAGGTSSGWQNTYVRASYSRGVEHADRAIRAAGGTPPPGAVAQTFNQPIHARSLELLFARNFNELRGITDATAQQISRVVTQGLATGQGPREMARELTRVVDTIGRNRSLVLARTETIRAHQEATLNRFEQGGVDRVVGLAEFATAGDDRVCPDCQELEGQTFTLDAARGIIPVHPNCRCVWLPVVRPTRSSPR